MNEPFKHNGNTYRMLGKHLYQLCQNWKAPDGQYTHGGNRFWRRVPPGAHYDNVVKVVYRSNDSRTSCIDNSNHTP